VELRSWWAEKGSEEDKRGEEAGYACGIQTRTQPATRRGTCRSASCRCWRVGRRGRRERERSGWGRALGRVGVADEGRRTGREANHVEEVLRRAGRELARGRGVKAARGGRGGVGERGRSESCDPSIQSISPTSCPRRPLLATITNHTHRERLPSLFPSFPSASFTTTVLLVEVAWRRGWESLASPNGVEGYTRHYAWALWCVHIARR